MIKDSGLKDFQWFSILICTILGAGILSLPRIIAKDAGRDGWLGILLAGIGVCFLATLVWLLCKRFPTKTMPEISITIMGKPLGIALSLVYVCYTFAMGGVVLRLFHELTKTWILIWTPPILLYISFFIPVIYIAYNNPFTIGRLVEILTILTAFMFLLWLVPLKDFSMLNLRPVGAEGIRAIAQAMGKTYFSFLGFEVLLVFYPFIANQKKVLPVTIQAITTITLIYIGNAIAIYGTLGVEQTVLQKWPLISYLRTGVLPFIQRVDAIVLFFWTTQVVVETAIQYYAGTVTLANLTKGRRHDIWALCCWPLVYLVAVLPRRLNQVFRVAELVGRWGLVTVMAIVVILLVVALVRGLDERKEAVKEK